MNIKNFVIATAAATLFTVNIANAMDNASTNPIATTSAKELNSCKYKNGCNEKDHCGKKYGKKHHSHCKKHNHAENVADSSSARSGM